MATIAKSGTPSPSTLLFDPAQKRSGLLAGEAIAAGDACYVKASDGRVWRSTGAATGAASKVRGFAAEAAPVGEAVTLLDGVMWRYGAALTPGTDVYLAASAGAIADAPSTGGVAVVGYVYDATRIFLHRGT